MTMFDNDEEKFRKSVKLDTLDLLIQSLMEHEKTLDEQVHRLKTVIDQAEKMFKDAEKSIKFGKLKRLLR